MLKIFFAVYFFFSNLMYSDNWNRNIISGQILAACLTINNHFTLIIILTDIFIGLVSDP